MWDEQDWFLEIAMSILFLVVTCIFLLIASIPFWEWKGSSVQARLYNEKHGTSYTTSDFFWGGKQINQQTQTIKIEQ